MGGRIGAEHGAQRWAARLVLLMAFVCALAACSRSTEGTATGSRQEADTVAGTATIAVLPLANVGDDAQSNEFADGMALHLVRALARVPGVVVISPESSFRFRGSSELNSVIGGKLGATHLLHGGVHRKDGRLQLDMELVQASDGSTLWSRHFQRVDRELFALQDEVVAGVATALHAGPLPRQQDDRPPGANLAAYEAVLHGDALAAQGDVFSIRQAVQVYQDALALEPAYAYAHARLALARIDQLIRFPLDEGDGRALAELARRDVAEALRLDPASVEAHLANAAWLAGVAHDAAGASVELRRALVLRPRDTALLKMQALQQIEAGQLNPAADTLRLSLQTNPLSAPTLYTLGSVYLGLADYPQAEHELREALTLEPELPLAQAFLAMAVFQQNRTAEAIVIAKRESVPLWRSYALAMAYWANGERAQSDEELQVLIRQHAKDAATQIAGVYAQRDDEAQMFHWLEEARRTHDPGLAEIRYMPFVARYANDPRFIALVKAQGLVPAK